VTDVNDSDTGTYRCSTVYEGKLKFDELKVLVEGKKYYHNT